MVAFFPLRQPAPSHKQRSRRVMRRANGGVIAQLGERLNGIQEVSGSIPLGSTT